MSEMMRLEAKVTIGYDGNVMSVLVHDGQDVDDHSIRLYVGRDGIEVEDLRGRLKGAGDE